MKKVKIKTAFLSLHTLLQSVFKSKYEQKLLATLTLIIRDQKHTYSQGFSFIK